jgi:D-sedoheptulose 7-phosphate isomerase
VSKDLIKEQIRSSIAVKQAMLEGAGNLSLIECLAQQCVDALRKDGKVIFAGNGGSFADAQHLSAEFVSRFMYDRAPLASVALGTNSSAMSAISNDYGYEQVFSREFAAIAKAEDVFVPISTSGNSPNVLAAVTVAREMGIATVGLAGETGGKMKSLCDCICVPSTETARIQECHIMIGHILCALVEERCFPKDKPQ